MMSMATDSVPLEVSIEASSTDYAADDPGWRAQVVSLRTALRDADLDDVRRQETPAPGHKAGVEEVILALGTSGAITAAVEVIRAWLARDRSRRLTVRYRDGDRDVSVDVDGTMVSNETMESALTAALEQLPHGG